MDWKIISKYVLYLFVFTAAAAFPFGFIRGFMASSGGGAPTWTTIGQAISVPVASLLVYMRLGYVKPIDSLKLSLVVGFLCWIISFPINVLLMKQNIAHWASGIIAILITATIGALLGKSLYSWKNKNQPAV
jgi:hypothetical protein